MCALFIFKRNAGMSEPSNLYSHSGVHMFTLASSRLFSYLIYYQIVVKILIIMLLLECCYDIRFLQYFSFYAVGTLLLQRTFDRISTFETTGPILVYFSLCCRDFGTSPAEPSIQFNNLLCIILLSLCRGCILSTNNVFLSVCCLF